MSKMMAKGFAKKFAKPLILLAMVVVMSILQPKAFPTLNNFVSIVYAISLYGIMVCGAIYPMLLAGVDLSIGSVAAMSGCATVMTIIKYDYSGKGVFLGIAFGLLLCMIVGLVHGLIAANFNVPPFLITLASLNLVYGVAQLVTNFKTIGCVGPPIFSVIGVGRLWGLPAPVYILAFCTICSYLLLRHTVFGRQLYAVGGNKEAAALSGINVKLVTVIAYILSSVCAGIAGIVLASMNQQAVATSAKGYEADVLTAIVVGGTSLMGGEGSIQGALFGALLVGLLNNGLRLMSVPSTYHLLIKGICIIIAVAFDIRSKRSDDKKTEGKPLFKVKTSAGGMN